jgi:hypothetical protein
VTLTRDSCRAVAASVVLEAVGILADELTNQTLGNDLLTLLHSANNEVQEVGVSHATVTVLSVLDLTWDALAHRHYRASRPVKTNRYSARALVFQSEAGSISHRPANARMTSSGFNPARTTPAASAARRQQEPRRNHQRTIRHERCRYCPRRPRDAAILAHDGPAQPRHGLHQHIIAEPTPRGEVS